MTELNKPVSRKTSAAKYEKSKHRRVILSLEPTAKVGVRLEGTRQTYRVDAEVFYEFAVRLWVAAVECRTKQLVKSGMTRRSATAQARKELLKELS